MKTAGDPGKLLELLACSAQPGFAVLAATRSRARPSSEPSGGYRSAGALELAQLVASR